MNCFAVGEAMLQSELIGGGVNLSQMINTD